MPPNLLNVLCVGELAEEICQWLSPTIINRNLFALLYTCRTLSKVIPRVRCFRLWWVVKITCWWYMTPPWDKKKHLTGSWDRKETYYFTFETPYTRRTEIDGHFQTFNHGFSKIRMGKLHLCDHISSNHLLVWKRGKLKELCGKSPSIHNAKLFPLYECPDGTSALTLYHMWKMALARARREREVLS